MTDATRAGGGLLTVVVDDLDAQGAALAARGISTARREISWPISRDPRGAQAR